MYFALGALAAGLLALTITPAIWRRANRLSFARVESAMPMSLAEIQAEKDQLRAEFAVNTRRLEVTLGRLGEREAAQVIDTNLKRDEIARLMGEQAARAEMVRQLEERVTRLGNEVRATEEKLNDAHAELVAAMQLGEEQKLELVARDTEIGNFKDEVLARAAAESALIDARDELAAALTKRNIPFAFVTGYGREALPQGFRDALMVAKPFDEAALLATVELLIYQSASVVPLRRKQP